MEKKLPKVYANKIEKTVTNNRSIFYSSHEEKEEKSGDVAPFGHPNLKGKTVLQKLYTIFHGPNYVYKADVMVKRNGETKLQKIIGYNAKNIITIDNEVIPIQDIEDIDFAK